MEKKEMKVLPRFGVSTPHTHPLELEERWESKRGEKWSFQENRPRGELFLSLASLSS